MTQTSKPATSRKKIRTGAVAQGKVRTLATGSSGLAAPGGRNLLLHPRNRHQGRYDFAELIKGTPELAAFVIVNAHGDPSVNFANPAAVKVLNRALLKAYYGIGYWDIPDNYLCPPIPGRADYVHYLADLLAQGNGGVIPEGAAVRVLDIGVGANGIYPLIGHCEYGWRFLGTDIDAVALASVQAIIQSNQGLAKAIEVRRQLEPRHTFKGLLQADECFDLTLCNPPFHASPEEAERGSQRKWRGLGKSMPARKPAVLNFGGQSNELWCEGGEAFFVHNMIDESVLVRGRVFWFSTLISKESNLPSVQRRLKQLGARDIRIVDMAQGQKKSRFVAWTFLDAQAQQIWRKERWG